MGRFKTFSTSKHKKTQLHTTVEIRDKINFIVLYKSNLEKRNVTRDEVLLDMIAVYCEVHNIKEVLPEIMKENMEKILS